MKKEDIENLGNKNDKLNAKTMNTHCRNGFRSIQLIHSFTHPIHKRAAASKNLSTQSKNMNLSTIVLMCTCTATIL